MGQNYVPPPSLILQYGAVHAWLSLSYCSYASAGAFYVLLYMIMVRAFYIYYCTHYDAYCTMIMIY